MICPICDKKLTQADGSDGDFGGGEYHYTCNDGSHFYCYHFAYGSAEEGIGEIVLQSYWQDSKAKRTMQGEIKKIAIAFERNLLEEKK